MLKMAKTPVGYSLREVLCLYPSLRAIDELMKERQIPEKVRSMIKQIDHEALLARHNNEIEYADCIGFQFNDKKPEERVYRRLKSIKGYHFIKPDPKSPDPQLREGVYRIKVLVNAPPKRAKGVAYVEEFIHTQPMARRLSIYIIKFV